MKYQIAAGTPITDATAYPGGACTPDAGYSSCVTEGQLKSQERPFIAADGIPTSLTAGAAP